MSSSTEIKLQNAIEGCLENDRKAQKFIYEKYFGIMMSISMRYCSSWSEAMEVVNNGFLKIFLKVGDYTGKGSFEGWMKRIIVNTALDYLKSLKPATEDIDDKNIFDSEFYVENDALSNFSVQDILEQIQSLPPMSRAVFNMNIIEGYKHKDIAEQLEISEGTSHWHLQNARKLLKNKLSTF